MIAEIFPVVTEEGEVVGKATRGECHSGSFLLHPVVHLHVFNSEGKLFLQKRVATKDIQPDKWDTSVGGHIDFGEDVLTALKRESREELGIRDYTPVFMFRYKYVSDREAELVNSFYTVYKGEIIPDPMEISEGGFWSFREIKEQLGKGVFTPNFEGEFERLLAFFTTNKITFPTQ